MHNWLPFSVILVNGIASSLQFTDRILSVKITDGIGLENDTCEIICDDRDNKLPLLNAGDIIIPILGNLPSGGIVQLGIYTVEDVEYSEPAKQWAINCQAVDFINTTIGNERTVTYKEKTIKQIADEIAGRQNTSAIVDKELTNIKIEHFNQTKQSDLDALAEIARKYGGVATMKHGKIIVKKPFNGKDIFGMALIVKSINYQDVSKLSFKQQKREDCEGITASYIDGDKAKRTKITVGNKDKARELKETFADKEQAIEAAQAALIRSQSFKRTISFTMAGTSSLAAETPIIFTHPRAEINGTWIIDKVTHNFTSSGYSTDVECLNPIDAAEKLLSEHGIKEE